MPFLYEYTCILYCKSLTFNFYFLLKLVVVVVYNSIIVPVLILWLIWLSHSLSLSF